MLLNQQKWLKSKTRQIHLDVADINSDKLDEAIKAEDAVQSRKKSDSQTKVAKEKSISSQKQKKNLKNPQVKLCQQGL